MNDHTTNTPSGSEAIISLRGVTKIFGHGNAAVHALRGVDLDIMAGEFVAIMGPSGSGKSTAMNIIGCLDMPTSGRYFFSGRDVAKFDRYQRALLRRNFLGFVFQRYNLLARTSAIENVELPLIYQGISGEKRRKMATAILERVGLAGKEKRDPSQLSGGEQQRVAIARAIVSAPKVLLADEPTGNLDTARSREIMELLLRLNREEGITSVMVTHEPDMAQYADRHIQFVDGRIAAETRGNQVVADAV
jgi:putative ABC transport system ATP-binding protein